MLQLHLSDQQLHCPLRCGLYWRLDGTLHCTGTQTITRLAKCEAIVRNRDMINHTNALTEQNIAQKRTWSYVTYCTFRRPRNFDITHWPYGNWDTYFIILTLCRWWYPCIRQSPVGQTMTSPAWRGHPGNCNILVNHYSINQNYIHLLVLRRHQTGYMNLNRMRSLATAIVVIAGFEIKWSDEISKLFAELLVS